MVAASVLVAAAQSLATAELSADDARVVVSAVGNDAPAALRTSPDAFPSAWQRWLAAHRTRVRARLERGDEDSVVNFWLYGTSFTRLPPAREDELARLPDRSGIDRLLDQRLDDLISALASPKAGERLSFARRVIERRGIDLSSRTGTSEAKRYLSEARQRALVEFATTDERLRSIGPRDPAAALAVQSTIFSDRGLSSDTSLLVDFGIDQALAALRSGGVLDTGAVRRVAIVGPGLDFTNKADGYDFYPQQTIQPFAVMDSLFRLGLSSPGELNIVTFDVSARVNEHLARARALATTGAPYLLHAPLSRDERWEGALVTYWRQLGRTIGDDTRAVSAAAPPDVDVRALNIRPAVVASITPIDLDIVIERLEPLPAAERFDLIVATNVFVYYSRFEQALATANIAHMLRPGGVLLSNTDVFTRAPMKSAVGYLNVSYSSRQGDHIFSYQRE